ncbi:hypothetical protein GTY23_23200 [Streptomyces sp. SID5998]|nr:hypothetical protein [Streptomyces sp. SID5998]
MTTLWATALITTAVLCATTAALFRRAGLISARTSLGLCTASMALITVWTVGSGLWLWDVASILATVVVGLAWLAAPAATTEENRQP